MLLLLLLLLLCTPTPAGTRFLLHKEFEKVFICIVPFRMVKVSTVGIALAHVSQNISALSLGVAQPIPTVAHIHPK